MKIYKITGKNYEDKINKRDRSILLLVCKKSSLRDKKICLQAQKFIYFLQKHYDGPVSDLRIAMFDNELNDHPDIDKFNIESFPILIFYGKSSPKGKIFRLRFAIEPIIKWLNKKLKENNQGKIFLSENQYKELLLIMAKDKNERKKLEKMIKKAEKEKAKLMQEIEKDELN